jgi:DNA-binding MarR family transcriptional regulator
VSAPTKKPKANRWQQFNGFVDLTMQTLTPAEVRVWLVLFRDVKATGQAKTGQTDLARRTGLSVRMVRYALTSLVKKDLVKVVRQGRLGQGASVYKVRGFVPGD